MAVHHHSGTQFFHIYGDASLVMINSNAQSQKLESKHECFDSMRYRNGNFTPFHFLKSFKQSFLFSFLKPLKQKNKRTLTRGHNETSKISIYTNEILLSSLSQELQIFLEIISCVEINYEQGRFYGRIQQNILLILRNSKPSYHTKVRSKVKKYANLIKFDK